MTVVLDGSSLSIEKLVAIARGNEEVRLAPEALARIFSATVMPMLSAPLPAGREPGVLLTRHTRPVSRACRF